MGKHVVVTGGEGNLATTLGRVFRNAGYEVTSPGRDVLDVCDPDSVCNFFRHHPCDLLVCCAGVTKDALLSRAGDCDWDLVWQTNYQGAKRCAETVLPAMIDKAEGHIVFLSSHSALHPPEGQVAYAAAKRALIGLCRDLAVRHGKDNIRVHVVLPGFLDNRMTSEVSPARKETVIADHALGRLNTMDCVAEFIRFLHESMPHTSGQWFQLDSRESML